MNENLSITFPACGRKVLITGASGGIGRAIARRFAENGDALFLHSFRNQEFLTELREEFPDTTIQISSRDLRDIKEQDALISEAWEWGNGLDILIQTAGVDILTGPRREWSYEEKLNALWQVDVQATIRLARAFSERLMKKSASGIVLMTGWNAVSWGMAGDSAELFAAVKGAVTAFARCLAQKTGPNIRVHCIAPGWIQTLWGQNAPTAWQEHARKDSLLERWGTPEDIANAVFFLCSPEAAFLNGLTLPVDGGKRF
ncbi:MAG: SDR family oxidoreductase [Planctomycetia bacterium]|nr:SDR family oxidoreductase [Planctomycetia bacterium]